MPADPTPIAVFPRLKNDWNTARENVRRKAAVRDA